MQQTKTSSFNKMGIKDIITIVILTAVSIVLIMVANTVTMFNYVLNLVFTFGLVLCLCAPIYILMLHRVNKRFTTLLFMGIFAVMYTIMGYWYVGILILLVAGILEFFMRKPDSYKKPWKNTISYTAFGLTSLSSSFLPLWLFWDAFEKTAINNGMNMDYLNTYKDFYTNPAIVVGIIAFTIFASIAGCIISYLIFNKYFKKAGLID